MIEIGRIAIKIAGREANKVCVVTDVISDSFVIIDGDVKRRKCNINHLESLDKKIEITKDTPTEKIHELLKKEGFELTEKKPKREIKPRPKRIKVKKLEKLKEQVKEKGAKK